MSEAEELETIELGPEESALVFNREGAFQMHLAQPEDENSTSVPPSAIAAVYCAMFLRRPDLLAQVAEEMDEAIEEVKDGGEG